jgi:hypothetical protein
MADLGVTAVDVPTARLRLYDEAPRLLAHSDGGVDDVDAMAIGMSDADGMKGKADGQARRGSIQRIMGVPQKPIDAVMRYHNECAMQGRIHEKPKEAFAQLSDKEKRRYEDEYKAELVKYHKAMADHQAKNPLWKTLLELAVPKLSGMFGATKEHHLSILAQVPVITRREALLEQQAWVGKFSFNAIVGAAIGVNAVATYIDVDFPPDSILAQVAQVMQVICFIVFSVEFLFRLGTHGMMYFGNRWLQFDFVMLVAMQADVYFMFLRSTAVQSTTSSSSENTQYRAMRAFRVMRVMKMLNYIQLVDALRDLFLLASTLVMSIGPVFRVFAMLLPFLWILAAILTELQFSLKDLFREMSTDDPEIWAQHFLDVENYFGTMTKSSFTMFAFATFNGWSSTLRTIRDLNPLMAIVAFLGLVVINLVFFNTCVAIIVDKTVMIAIKREGMIMEGKRATELKLVDEVKRIFEAADLNKNGELTFDEFNLALSKPSMVKKLAHLDIPNDDAEELFNLLDADHGGTLTISELINGIMKMRGQAPARDLVATYSLVRRELKRVNESLAKVDRIMAVTHTVSVRLDNWWSSFEAVGLNHDEKLAERRLWFVRSQLKETLKNANSDENAAAAAREWEEKHLPRAPAPVVPAPPTEAPPEMRRRSAPPDDGGNGRRGTSLGEGTHFPEGRRGRRSKTREQQDAAN